MALEDALIAAGAIGVGTGVAHGAAHVQFGEESALDAAAVTEVGAVVTGVSAAGAFVAAGGIDDL